MTEAEKIANLRQRLKETEHPGEAGAFDIYDKPEGVPKDIHDVLIKHRYFYVEPANYTEIIKSWIKRLPNNGLSRIPRGFGFHGYLNKISNNVVMINTNNGDVFFYDSDNKNDLHFPNDPKSFSQPISRRLDSELSKKRKS